MSEKQLDLKQTELPPANIAVKHWVYARGYYDSPAARDQFNWCKESFGSEGQEWSYTGERFYFRSEKYKMMFVLKWK